MQSLRNLRTLRSLRHRNFRLLLEGALISSSGDFMQNVAQSWLVWHVSNSPVAIGVVAFFDTLPRLLVGAVGGAIADRFDRRRVLMITQTAAMVQAIIYWLAVQFDVIELWHIAVLAFFLGIVNTINQTARQSLVNSLVPKDELLNAIGLQSSVFNFSKILGPSAGGIDHRVCRHRRVFFGQRNQLRVSAFQSLPDGVAALGKARRMNKVSVG